MSAPATAAAGASRRLAPRDALLLLPLVGAALAAARGRTTLAAVLGVLAVAALVARIVVGPAVHRPIAAAGRWCERAFTAAAVAVLWAVLVLPGWLWRRLRRADARAERRARAEPSAWVATPEDAASERSFGAPHPVTARSGGSRALQAVGLVAVLLVADVAIGTAWQRFTRSEAADRLGVGADGTFDDARAQDPALADDPWALEHLRDMQRLPQAYWPYVVNRPQPYESETVTVDGWARRSYEPAAAATEDLPVIAFFGGSTTFGEGQRDEHTIPSEIARLAEEAGTPVRVVNYGQRSWTAWQEMILFDQLTADPTDPDHPDLVVFYDGGNELLQQTQASTAGWPTTYNADGIARSLTGEPAGAGDATGVEAASLTSQVWDWYSSRSMLLRVGRTVRRTGTGASAPADVARTDDRPEELGERTAEVYLRAQSIAAATAARRGIPTTFFWQPLPSWRSQPAYVEATRIVEEDGDGVEVIADALDDHQDVFFDYIHTNEAGARLVAERMWETLAPEVARAS